MNFIKNERLRISPKNLLIIISLFGVFLYLLVFSQQKLAKNSKINTRSIKTIDSIKTSTSDLITSWQTREEQDFTIKFPSGWGTTRSFSGHSFAGYYVSSKGGGSVVFSIEKANNSSEKFSKISSGKFFGPTKIREITLGEITANEEYGCFGVKNCKKIYRIIFPYGDSTYLIKSGIGWEDVYHQIISTVKFKSPVSDTNDWKTYSHFADAIGLGYELMVPSSWTETPWAGEGDYTSHPIANNYYPKEYSLGNGCSDRIFTGHVQRKNAEGPEGKTEIITNPNGITFRKTVQEPFNGRIDYNAYADSPIGTFFISGSQECVNDYNNIFDKVLKSLKIITK